MRLLITSVIIVFFVFSSLLAVDLPKSKSASVCLDNIDIDFNNGTVIITPRSGDDFRVEITDDGELFLNGKKIRISSEERELLRDYRRDMIHLVRRAEEIGIKGAKVGVHAVSGLIEVICTELELDELEAELESESARIEKEAQELEELAAQLEDMHYELKNRISELNKLRSF